MSMTERIVRPLDDSRTPAVEVRGVSKEYLKEGLLSSAGNVKAVDAVSFTLADGETASIIGASGCGKSTVLKMIGGLLGPSAGEIRILSKPVTGPSRDTGMMFQQPTLLPWRSVLDNILLPIEIRDGAGEARRQRERAKGLVEMVGLSGFENAKPRELSGGMAQRAAICRMLVTEPKLLLLDEPFGALDEFTREQMNVEFQRICIARGAASIVVTHSIQEAVFLSDVVIVMSPRPGRIIAKVRIDLPRPRDPEIMTSPEFNGYVREIRNLLMTSDRNKGRIQ
jgi:NitT/TauT family transport system ATP-binding protein